MIEKSRARPTAAPQPTRGAPKTAATASLPAPAKASAGWTPKARTNPFQKLAGKVQDKLQAGVAKAGLTAYAPLQPPPTLKRPVVMLPGLTLGAKSYDPLARHLASNPANGPVATYVAADGKFHLGGKSGRVMAQSELANAKVFQMEYRNAKGAPSDKAHEVASMLRAVNQATHAQLDVVTHSAGGTDFRQYLDTRKGADAGVPIHRAVMIGPVSHGTVMGNIGDVTGGLIGVKKAAGELGIGDPLVKHLDSTWDKQRAQIATDVTVIAISGAPTAGPGGIQDGDGFVQIDEIDLAKAKTVVLHGANPTPLAHLKEVGYSGVINQVGAALGQD